MTRNIFVIIYQIILLVIDFLIFFFKAVFLLFKTLFDAIFPSAPKSVTNEIVLITGGGHGLGRQLAHLFAERKARVVLWDINEENCKQTVADLKKLGCNAYSYQCDVSNKDEVAKVAKLVIAQVGNPTILVNNAGILHCQPFLNLNDQQLERIVGINLTAHFWTIRQFLPAMIQMKKGHIVCISSMAGLFGFANLVDYGATKFGCAGLMKHLRMELRALGHNNIHCTTIHPTIINTGMAKKPRYRHAITHPVIETDYAANCIMEAILRNKTVVTIPSSYKFVHGIINALPISVQDAFSDFVSVGLDAHE